MDKGKEIMVKSLIALLSFPVVAMAELPQELVMPTDVGRVAISVKECPVKNKHGFGYEAYATEFKDGVEIIHKGCWTKKMDIVYIWFYDESEPIVASYKDHYFKPAISM